MEQKVDNYALFRRGADDGLLLGGYLSVLFFAMAYSLTVPPLSLLALVMMAGVPVVTYVFLRRAYVKEHGTTRFSALWMQGIVTFFCGSLILALVSFVFMRWIEPGFISGIMETLVEIYDGTDWPSGKEAADMIGRALDAGLIPKAIQVSMEMLWTGVFTGSLLSMIISLLVQSRKVAPRR